MNLDLSIYLVTDPQLCAERGVVETVRQAVAGGVRIVQLRDKTATDAQIVEQLIAVSAAIGGRALLVVDDRVDAVLEARRRGARVDGVHVGQSDLPVAEVRRRLGPDALVGLTANTPEHLDAIRALPHGTVDYVGIGVIRPTTTKPNHPPALGVDGFAALAADSPVPAVAIGGIGLGDAAGLRDAGAAGIAVVSAICAADDPRAAAQELRRHWSGRTAPRVLSIAGSDPSGGAGIQADLKSIAANGGYGMAAITALTVQNTHGVRDIHIPPASFLRAQLDALSDDIEIDAVKIGMLAGTDVIHAVADWLSTHRPPTVVLDPVMVSTSGDRLLDADAEQALKELLTAADVVTPNLPELAVLTGQTVASHWPAALEQAQHLAAAVGTLVLVKGGHLPGADVPDALVGPDGPIAEFTGERIDTDHTHGTGCSLSAALATRRAVGDDWPRAIETTRAWLRESLRGGATLDVGRGHGPISHFSGFWQREGACSNPTAEDIAADWWQRIAEVREQIDALPFICALADGTLSRDAFLFYIQQDALYLREYARVLAAASMHATSAEEQAFWAQGAQGALAGELALHASWLTPEQGVSTATFDAEPGPVTTAYLDHLRAVAFGGDYAELVAAVLPCYWLYSDLGRRLHAGEFGEYALDPQHPYASWLATYADPAFDAATRRAVEITTRIAAASDEATRMRMLDAFRRASVLEREFFAAAGA